MERNGPIFGLKMIKSDPGINLLDAHFWGVSVSLLIQRLFYLKNNLNNTQTCNREDGASFIPAPVLALVRYPSDFKSQKFLFIILDSREIQ